MTHPHSAGELFNYEDLEIRAGEYLEKIRKCAREILENAAREAEAERLKILREADELRKNAEEEGYRAGFDAGREAGLQDAAVAVAKQVQAEVALRLKPASEAFTKIADALEASRGEWKSHWEKNAIHLVCLIAGRIIHREIRNGPEIETRWIREALELTAGGNVTLRLNPDDLHSLRPTLEQMIRRMRNLGSVELHEDETLKPGDSELQTQFGEIDMRVETQLRRVMEELM